MYEFIRQKAAWLAGLLLAWVCYGALSEEGKAKASEKKKLPVIEEEYLALRDPTQPATELRDPFLLVVKDGVSLYGKAAADRAGVTPDVVLAFELVLESVVAFGDGDGVARISSYTVGVGDELDRLDPATPPVLVRVEGTVAEILHRGNTYRLDLERMPRIQVGTPAVDESADDGELTPDELTLTEEDEA